VEPPDRGELVVRFGCGAMLGCVVAGFVLLRFDVFSWPWWLVVGVLVIIAFGYGAMRWGDQFWQHEAWSWLRWWWW
jgi:hypothetical protein